MPSSYTSLLGFVLPVTGELSGTWGTTVNAQLTQLIEDSIAGLATASVAGGNWTLSTASSGASNEARLMVRVAGGAPRALPARQAMRRFFEKTCCLMTATGEDDNLIQPEAGLHIRARHRPRRACIC
jgi:hypothetical protein